MQLLPTAAPVRTGVVPAASGDKSVRDAYGTPNVRTSENFAIHWGNDGDVPDGAVDSLLDAFELAWQVQIDDMGHPKPYGTDAYKFNVYLGDTGGGAPGGYGTGGYYYTDSAQWPMIVVSAGTLWDEVYSEHTATHEFYHAVQGATNRYAYEGLGAWYWEATAEWAALETQPNNTSNGTFVYGYLLLPKLPVNFFDYPDTGELQEYHQYGAFLFPHDLTEATDWSLIRDSWTDAGTEEDPMEVLDQLLRERGESPLNELWLDHLAHNAAMDYRLADLFQSHLDTYGSWYPDESTIDTTVSGAGGEGAARGQNAPGRYGALTVRLKEADPGTVKVTVTGESQGTLGSDARYGARIVRVDSKGKAHYQPVSFDGAEGSGRLEGVEAGDEVFLAMGAWSANDTHWLDERFPLSWTMEVVKAKPGRTGDGGANDEIELACATGNGGPAGSVALLTAVVAAWRRRRSVSAVS